LKRMYGVVTSKKECNSSWIVELNTLWYIGFQPFLYELIISFNFLQFDEFIFSFQDTYNSRLKERYGDDPSTDLDLDLDLWLEAGSSSGPDRIRYTDFLTLRPRT
jgi:hypothetical protein